jgi:hypothetical protein
VLKSPEPRERTARKGNQATIKKIQAKSHSKCEMVKRRGYALKLYVGSSFLLFPAFCSDRDLLDGRATLVAGKEYDASTASHSSSG